MTKKLKKQIPFFLTILIVLLSNIIQFYFSNEQFEKEYIYQNIKK